MRIPAAIAALAWSLSLTAAANSSLELLVDSGLAFPSGPTISVGPDAAQVFDLRLTDARGNLDPESVALTLNGTSIKGSARFNRRSRGAHLIIDRRTQNIRILCYAPRTV